MRRMIPAALAFAVLFAGGFLLSGAQASRAIRCTTIATPPLSSTIVRTVASISTVVSTQTVTITAQTTTVPSPTASSFSQGIWTQESAGGLTNTKLAHLRALGFDFVLADPDPALLDRVQAAGLRAIFWLGN